MSEFLTNQVFVAATWLSNLCFIAVQAADQGTGGEAAPANGGGAAGPPATPEGGLLQLLPMIIGGFILFYFIVIRPQQREQQRRREQLNSLKKNDKVVTIGGIIGTIVDVSQDGSRVTLKVDDGTRMKFLRSSIQGPYDEKAQAEAAET